MCTCMNFKSPLHRSEAHTPFICSPKETVYRYKLTLKFQNVHATYCQQCGVLLIRLLLTRFVFCQIKFRSAA